MKKSKVQRPDWEKIGKLPLLSLGLACVLLLSFPAIQIGYSSLQASVQADIKEAVGFAIRNPTVQIPPRLLPVIRAVLPNFDSNETFAFLKKSGDDEARQQEFDALVTRTFEQLDRHPFRALGVVPATPRIAGFVAHPFVHVGWVQLLGAVLLLLLVGPLLEPLWGRGAFVALVALSGLVSAGVFCLVHGGADRALLGAGGVVSGLTAAACVRFAREKVDLLRWLSPLKPVELIAPGWMLALLWVAYEGALKFVVPGAFPDGIDTAFGYTAHAAGALFGGAFAFGAIQLELEKRFGESPPTTTERPRQRERFDLERVSRARARGDSEAAFEMLLAESRHSARNRDAVTTLWEMAIERGEAEIATPAMIQLVREEIRRGAEDVGVSHWRELTQHQPEARVELASLLKLIPHIRHIDGDGAAVIALQQAMDCSEDGPSAREAAVIACLAADLEANIARAAAKRALADETLPEQRRAEVESIVQRLRTREKAAISGPNEEKELPVNVFYAEQDRSGFGDVGDLTQFGAPGETFPCESVVSATPVTLESGSLVLELESGGFSSVAYPAVSVVSVAGVGGLGPKPVVIVDVFAADPANTNAELCIYRLRCDRFDPRRLVVDEKDPLVALQSFLKQILARTQARPLPDPAGACANPVKLFESLEAYQAWASEHIDI
ncbi:MAG: rhomboid family intramembrane serine protease [Deltaproteobacteria bacterium]|jgi:membrane associated rhomboid family serine protease|nr:rhomboid family intramembrane serine protease [Deltaproteobacteria bacterium]